MEGQSSMISQSSALSDESCLDEATGSQSRKSRIAFDFETVKSSREQPAPEAGKSTKVYYQIKRVLNPHGPFSRQWNSGFLLSTIVAISLDPLFLYVPGINGSSNCIEFDKKLAITAVVLRSAMDCFYLIYIAVRIQADFFIPFLRHKRGHSVNINHWKIARSYPCSSFFLVDILSVLPLLQVIILILPNMRRSRFLHVMTLMKLSVSFQCVPRVLRIHQVFKRERKTFAALAHAPWAKAAFNLMLYMLASHVLGALWYFYALERVADCWQKNNGADRKMEESYRCDYINGERRELGNCCQANSTFDFGMFVDAMKPPILQATFLQKFFHCFRWGIQNLSCFGQNIKTSSYVWENCFAAFISVVGLVLFIFLIGNMQTYLQIKTIRSEEMRLKTQEIEQWKPFSKLPDNIQSQVKKYQRYKWQETKGVDVEYLLRNLPLDLKRQIKCKLGFELVRKVEEFNLMGQRALESLCCCMKPVLFVERNYIVREGDPVDQMVFIVQGRLCINYSGRSDSELTSETSNHGRHVRLESGDFCGEELLQWIRDPFSPRLPISKRKIRAQTKVEAFALLADDLKLVFTQNQWRLHRELRLGNRSYNTSGFGVEYWLTWAARVVQSAWRKRCEMAQERMVVGSCNSTGKLLISI